MSEPETTTEMSDVATEALTDEMSDEALDRGHASVYCAPCQCCFSR